MNWDNDVSPSTSLPHQKPPVLALQSGAVQVRRGVPGEAPSAHQKWGNTRPGTEVVAPVDLAENRTRRSEQEGDVLSGQRGHENEPECGQQLPC